MFSSRPLRDPFVAPSWPLRGPFVAPSWRLLVGGPPCRSPNRLKFDVLSLRNRLFWNTRQNLENPPRGSIGRGFGTPNPRGVRPFLADWAQPRGSSQELNSIRNSKAGDREAWTRLGKHSLESLWTSFGRICKSETSCFIVLFFHFRLQTCRVFEGSK